MSVPTKVEALWAAWYAANDDRIDIQRKLHVAERAEENAYNAWRSADDPYSEENTK